MTSQLVSRHDVDFLLHAWLKAGALADRETVDALLDLSEKLAADHFLTHFKRADSEEPRLEDGEVRLCPAIGEALAQYAEMGLFAAGFPEAQGGLGLPHLVCAASFAFFAAANPATAAYPMLTIANARLIAKFGTAAQFEAFARPEIEGRWLGTMCLSEPHAGSSLADIATRATPDGSDALGGRYRLTGNKMWISAGDHDLSENIVHLVLAKVPGADGRLPEGTPGISLFIVPKILPDGSRNDVSVAGLNHKMGQRGTANCLLNFGERDGATGWIVGEPGDGLRQMFQMMDEARIAVGLCAAAIGYRGYLLSADYARERHQGRPAGRRAGAPVAIIEHPDVRRMLLQQKCYVEGALALCLYCARLVDTAKTSAEDAALLALLTPVAKAWPSEFGLAANDLAIQIHGGYGYTRDFDVEQLWRDNRLNPIHEGTHGIQALDLLGRKVLAGDGASLRLFAAEIRAFVDSPAGAAQPHSTELLGALERLESVSAWLGEQAAANPAQVGAAAVDYLHLFGYVAYAFMWARMAAVAQAKRASDEPFYAAKLATAQFYFARLLPRIHSLEASIRAGSDSLYGLDAEQF